MRHPVRPIPATVKRALPNEMFLVETEAGVELTVHASGKMRNRFVRLLTGDPVLVDRSPFDATKGRIVHDSPTRKPACTSASVPTTLQNSESHR